MDRSKWCRYAAIGTDRKLYIYTEGTAYDVTPIRRGPTALTNPFTTNGTNNVTVQIQDMVLQVIL